MTNANIMHGIEETEGYNIYSVSFRVLTMQ